MKKTEIITGIQEMLNKNPQIEPCFVPVIEAFLIRLVKQHNLDEKEFNTVLKKYDDLRLINWQRFRQGVVGKFKKRYLFSDSLSEFCKNGVKISDKEIEISIEYLKGILLGDQRIIQKFINTSFHEQGHFIQFVQRNKYMLDDGLMRSRFYWDKLEGIIVSLSRSYNK